MVFSQERWCAHYCFSCPVSRWPSTFWIKLWSWMKTPSTTSRWRSSPGFLPEDQLLRTSKNHYEPGWKLQIETEGRDEGFRRGGRVVCERAHCSSVDLTRLFPGTARQYGKLKDWVRVWTTQRCSIAESVRARPLSRHLSAVVSCLFVHSCPGAREPCSADNSCMILAWDWPALKLPPDPQLSMRHSSPEWL